MDAIHWKSFSIESNVCATIRIVAFLIKQIIIIFFSLFHLQSINVSHQQSESQNGDEQIIVTKEITSTEKSGKKKSSIDSDSSKNGSTKKKKKSKKSVDSEKENISVVSTCTRILLSIAFVSLYFFSVFI